MRDDAPSGIPTKASMTQAKGRSEAAVEFDAGVEAFLGASLLLFDEGDEFLREHVLIRFGLLFLLLVLHQDGCGCGGAGFVGRLINALVLHGELDAAVKGIGDGDGFAGHGDLRAYGLFFAERSCVRSSG